MKFRVAPLIEKVPIKNNEMEFKNAKSALL